MRKLYLGGSFNPIHHGHLLCGVAALEKLGFDRLVLIPAAVPPLKAAAADMAPAADRFAMCQLAAQGVPSIEVDGIELDRSATSFTIDTVRELRKRGAENITWLIGADALQYLSHWHKLPDLLKEAQLVVMTRPGWATDWQNLPIEIRFLQHSTVSVPQIQISATQIRERVRHQREINFMTPQAVVHYIDQCNLYRGDIPRER